MSARKIQIRGNKEGPSQGQADARPKRRKQRPRGGCCGRRERGSCRSTAREVEGGREWGPWMDSLVGAAVAQRPGRQRVAAASLLNRQQQWGALAPHERQPLWTEGRQVHTETSVHRGQCERMHTCVAPRRRRRLSRGALRHPSAAGNQEQRHGRKRRQRAMDGKLEGVEQELMEDGGNGARLKRRGEL